MSNVLDQWLGDSISALEMLEREVNEHHAVIERAMSTIREHTAAVERLEMHIEVIRGAATRIETAVDDSRFEQTFEASYANSYHDLRGDDESSGAPIRVDEGAGTPVLRVMPDGDGGERHPAQVIIAAGGHARLPPPPPSAAQRR